MEKIPKLSEAQQILIVNHPDYDYLQTWRFADSRMRGGAERYGHSWCEVNLKQDMMEELADIHNYCIMALIRIADATNDGFYDKNNETNRLLLDIIEQVNLLADVVDRLPDFEGPTSEEWVKTHGLV